MSISGCASISIPSTWKGGKLLDGKADSVEIKFGVARMLERNGKLSEARKAYLEILSAQSHAPSLHRLGVSAIRQNRLDEGLKHLAEAVAAGDASAELLGDYGYAQFLAGEMAAAEATLEKAVSLDPSKKRNVNNLAIVIGKQDRFSESFRLFRTAGSEADALANLAFIQSQSNELGKARENYSKALDLDPKLKVAAIGLLEVDKNINKDAVVKQEPNPQPKIEETRPERQAAWNQPVEVSTASESEPSQAFDRMLALTPLPLMDYDSSEELSDVAQQITELEEKIRAKEEDLAKRQESTRRLEASRLDALAKRKQLAELEKLVAQEKLAKRQELAAREELASFAT